MRAVIQAICLVFGFMSSINAWASDVEIFDEQFRFPEVTVTTKDQAKFSLHSVFADSPLTLVNIWATWCGPCVVELPELEKLAKNHKTRIAVYAVSADSLPNSSQVWKKIPTFGDFEALQFVAPRSKIMRTLHLTSLPVTYGVNKKGDVIFRVAKVIDWNSPENIRSLIEIASQSD